MCAVACECMRECTCCVTAHCSHCCMGHAWHVWVCPRLHVGASEFLHVVHLGVVHLHVFACSVHAVRMRCCGPASCFALPKYRVVLGKAGARLAGPVYRHKLGSPHGPTPRKDRRFLAGPSGPARSFEGRGTWFPCLGLPPWGVGAGVGRRCVCPCSVSPPRGSPL